MNLARSQTQRSMSNFAWIFMLLASGVWSGTSKLFEILYMAIWYIGPLNHVVPELDFIGTTGNGYPGFFIPFSIALIGRARQWRN